MLIITLYYLINEYLKYFLEIIIYVGNLINLS